MATIHLGEKSLFLSSNQPGPFAETQKTGPYLVLLPVWFAVPVRCRTSGALLPHHFTLTVRSCPLKARLPDGGIFLLHYPSGSLLQSRPPRRYLAPCFREVRTFLSRYSFLNKGSGRPADWQAHYA